MAGAEADRDRLYAVSSFTRELIEDLTRDRFRPGSVWTFFSRSWTRSLEDFRDVPGRVQSAWRWSALGAMVGATVLAVSFTFHPTRVTVEASGLWLLWYVAAVFFVLTHLGMVDDSHGRAYDRLLWPNGLSFLRLGLAPLVMWPCLAAAPRSATAPAWATLILGLALTDALDGWVARRLNTQTRMGRMLDPLADVAFSTFLVAGLFQAGTLPAPLFALMVLRYPGALMAVVVLYFLRGPAPLRPTAIGKTSFVMSNLVLIVFAVASLLRPAWLTSQEFTWAVRVLYLVTGANLAHLIHRGITWSDATGDR